MTLPNSLQAEREAIYKMIVYSNMVLARTLHPDDFFDPVHRNIFVAEKDLMLEHGTGDFLSICEATKDIKGVQDAGGVSFLAALCILPGPESTDDAVIRTLKHRRIQRDILSRQEEITGTSPEALPGALMRLSEEFTSLLPAAGTATKEEILKEMQESENTIPTGFFNIDLLLSGGIAPGALFLIAARPAVGKSALATNIAANLLKNGKKPCFFSLEMSRKQIMLRILAAMKRVPTKTVQNDAEDIINSVTTLPEIHIGTNDIDTIQMIALSTTADVIIIDYLGLITSNTKENRFQQLDELSRTLKLLAIHTKKPIILLTQLNREIEKAKSPRCPMLADLWGGGEKDADVITALWEPSSDTLEEALESVNGVQRKKQQGNVRQLEWTILKNRNGPTGFANITFYADRMLMIEKDYDTEAPPSELPF